MKTNIIHDDLLTLIYDVSGFKINHVTILLNLKYPLQ